MRGDAPRQANIMLAITPDQLVPADHPIRRIKPMVEAALAELSPLFEQAYARGGRPSVPPEHLLKAQLLMALFSVPAAAISGSRRTSRGGRRRNVAGAQLMAGRRGTAGARAVNA